MGRKAKIGLILMTEPQWGGGHQYAYLLASILLRQRDKYEIVVLSNNFFWRKWCIRNSIKYIRQEWDEYTEGEKKWIIRHRLLNFIYCNYFTANGKMLRKEEIDLLICGHQGFFLPNYKVKVLHPVHDLMHRYEPAFPEVKADANQREIFFQSIVKFAEGILVDSSVGRQQFMDSYLRGRHERILIKILPFTVPRYVMETKEGHVRTPAKYVFYPAQFWQHKNHLNLLRAINILKDEISDIHLVLAGSEKNALHMIKKYIKENKMEKCITILGFVSNEQIVYLYRHAAGLVMPSYFGPTNIPPLEAMALGCPVAVSDKYAMPEQIGKAGLFFNPDSPEEIADCISKMWKDKELCKKMIEEGYKKIDKWTEADFEKEFVKTVDRILKMK